MPDRLKLTYLLGQLYGPPRRAYKHYPINDANYAIVLKLLQDRYAQPYLLTHKMEMELNQLSRIPNDTEALRSRLDKLTYIYLLIKQAGINPDNQQYQCKIINSSPFKLAEEIQEQNFYDLLWTVQNTLQYIEKTLMYREQHSKPQHNQNNQHNQTSQENSQDLHNSNVFFNQHITRQNFSSKMHILPRSASFVIMHDTHIHQNDKIRLSNKTVV